MTMQKIPGPGLSEASAWPARFGPSASSPRYNFWPEFCDVRNEFIELIFHQSIESH
jgi:hypothetical protein